MSFTFRALRLTDWLVYSGSTRIDFPEFEPGRNLIVVHGQNGFGKTSFQRAMRYVFEGERLSKEELFDLWHEGARSEEGGFFEVALEFTHRGRQCKIIRGCDFKPWGDNLRHAPRLDLYFDGERQEDLEEDRIQEELLPRDCLDFVFFDGAEIIRYARGENENEEREAIEKILGIPATRNLRDDLGDVIRSLEKEQRQLLEKGDQAKELLLEISELEEKLRRYEKRLSEEAEKKRSLDSVQGELKMEREQIQAIEKELETLKEKTRRRASLEERIAEIDRETRQLVRELPLFMLEAPIRQVAEELRAREQISPKVQALDARLQTLRQLVEEDFCLCSREIDGESLAALRQAMASLEEMLAGRVSGSKGPSDDLRQLDVLRSVMQSRPFDPDHLIDRRSQLVTEMEEVETEIGRLKRQLKNHPDASVADISEQLGQIEQQIKDCTGSRESIEANRKRSESALKDKKRKLDALGIIDEQAKGVTLILQEAQKAQKAVSGLLDRLVQDRRSSIEAQATDVFLKITNKPDEYAGLRLRSDYSLEVQRHDGTAVDNEKLSAGEKEVVAYSFITALNLSSVDPAPFVMDTPFGHLDSGHRRGLLASLPELPVQAFLLATDRDLPPEGHDSIDRSIAKEFVLERDQKTASTSIQEDGV